MNNIRIVNKTAFQKVSISFLECSSITSAIQISYTFFYLHSKYCYKINEKQNYDFTCSCNNGFGNAIKTPPSSYTCSFVPLELKRVKNK